MIIRFAKVIACLNKKGSQFFDVFNQESVYIFKSRLALPRKCSLHQQAKANRLGGKSVLAHLKKDEHISSLQIYAKSI